MNETQVSLSPVLSWCSTLPGSTHSPRFTKCESRSHHIHIPAKRKRGDVPKEDGFPFKDTFFTLHCIELRWQDGHTSTQGGMENKI